MKKRRKSKNNLGEDEYSLRPKYDNNRIDIIKNSLISKDYDRTGALIVNYIKDYPDDMAAYIYYAKYLQELGFFDRCEKVLDFVFERDDFHNLEVWGIFLDTLNNNLLYQEKYDEAIMVMEKYDGLIKTYGKRFDEKYQYAAIKGGFKDRIDNDSNMYYRINSFNHFHTLVHINHRHIDSDIDSTFVPEFPFGEAYKYIKDNLEYATHTYQHGIYSLYYFNAPACGFSHGEKVDLIKVVALKDTNKIYTMYPVEKGTNFTPNDFPIKYGYSSGKKTKRLSQIDKFNMKYGK